LAWIKDLEIGAEITLDLVPDDLVQVVNQRVTIRLLDKRGPRCRLSIEAPRHVQLKLVEDGVQR